MAASGPDFFLCSSDMSGSDDLTAANDVLPRVRKKKASPLLVLAAGLMLFAAAVGAALILLRPVTLRIAVGPSGSSDMQLIQALAQHFSREGASVRLSMVQTAGTVDSIAVLAKGHADLAVARTDEEMPDGLSLAGDLWVRYCSALTAVETLYSYSEEYAKLIRAYILRVRPKYGPADGERLMDDNQIKWKHREE